MQRCAGPGRHVARVRGDALGAARRHRSFLPEAGRRRHRGGAAHGAAAGVAPAQRHCPQHRAAGNGRGHGDAGAGQRPGRRGHRRRRRDVPGVPPGGLGDRRLPRLAARRHRDPRPPRRRDGHQPVQLSRPAGARRGHPHRRGAQVRLQRVPRHEGVLHQRAVTAVPAPGRGLPRGHVAVLRGPGPQHIAGLPAARVRLRRVVPAQGPPVAAAPGPHQQRRHAAAGRHAGHERTGDQRGRGPGRRERRPHRRPARPELQDAHRRPAGEPEGGTGRAADRQGVRRPYLRPGRPPRPPGRCQPPLRRVETASSGAAAHARAGRGAAGRGRRHRFLQRSDGPGRAARDPAASSDRSHRPAGQRGRGAPRLRRARLVSRILIIVQNLPVPFDRRVWLECQALLSAGHQVAVICPKGDGDPSYQVIDTVQLYKYRPYAPGGSKAGFIAEYAYSFLATAWLTLKARRSGRFAVMQACNPPDIFWPIALALRALDRTRFVFDHHDLCPELYESRFPDGPKLPYKMLRALERRTHRTADHVISTNDSYRDIAVNRSGKPAGDVTIVRTGPDPDRLRRGEASAELRRGRRFLAAYIGVMGPQDGVDIVVRAADVVVHQLGREDIAFTLIGKGDCFDELVALRDELGLAGRVEFTGRAPDELVGRILSTADVGLSPDPKNPLNDVSTMNKTMEYMAFELPVVAFDLRETRVSAQEAAVYATPNDVREYAKALVGLIDDEAARAQLGKLARARIEDELAWSHQQRAYLGVYRGVTPGNDITGQAGG